MVDNYPARDHLYADIVNRMVTEYDNTPGGAPPGAVVQGVLEAQEGDNHMTTGTGKLEGMHRIPLDSDDVQFFIDRYGHEPRLWEAEDTVHVIANGIDTRQEMGGYFSDWNAAAWGITGRVKQDGMNDEMPETEQLRASGWYRDYLLSISPNEGVIGEMHPGSVNIDPKTKRPIVFPGGEETTDADLVEEENTLRSNDFDVQGKIDAITGEVSRALSRWAPLVGLFLIGLILTGYGVYVVFKG